MLYLQRLFKCLDLDYLCTTCYAPGHSAYNPIEHAWAPMSRKLTGVTLSATLPGEAEPPCQQKIADEQQRVKEEKVFNKALEELDNFWNGMTFSGHPIYSRGVKCGEEETPFSEYERVHAIVGKASSSEVLRNKDLVEELKFIASHCDRQPGEFTITKCQRNDCAYCKSHPIRATHAMAEFFKRGGQPNPVRGTDSEHYITYMEASEKQSLPSEIVSIRCELCPGYTFLSKTDETRHNRIIHK